MFAASFSWKAIHWDLFTRSRHSHARLNVPAAGAGGGARHYFDPLSRSADDNQHCSGLHGIGEFIHRSVQTWNLTLVFLSSLVLVFIEIYCAFSLVKGRNWARWVYLLTQITAAGYLWAASLGYGYPELFSIPGESQTRDFAFAGDAKTAGYAGALRCFISRLPVGGSSACNNVYNRSPRVS